MWFTLILVLDSLVLVWTKPNFVFFLTDDQDLLLGGLIPLKKTYSLIAENGAEFSNMFVTTPLCCPSRASILTGKYVHNHGVVNNSISGNCNSKSWQNGEELDTFITYLKDAGYSTFYSGKYLNQYGKASVGGVQHIPPGWDHWVSLVGNSCYYNYTLSVNGKSVFHGSDYETDYLTDVIVRAATDFLVNQNGSQPFFMFLSVPSPHDPFTPAPQYRKAFPNVTAPRTPNFNIPGGKHKHWLLRQPPSPLPEAVIDAIDETYRKRLQTLLSVDDGIDKIFQILKLKKMLNETYIFFTSDNGFHLGQFSLPWDKRQPYEFDVRVPLFVRGPNIKPGIKIEHPVLNIDFAPTILDLAELSVHSHFDGQSFAPMLQTHGKKLNKRQSFMIEHQGEASDKPIPGCPMYRVGEVHTCEIDCICEDSWNNTYICVREVSSQENSIACLFTYENFVEAYDLTQDPFQQYNVFPSQGAFFRSSMKLCNLLNIL